MKGFDKSTKVIFFLGGFAIALFIGVIVLNLYWCYKKMREKWDQAKNLISLNLAQEEDSPL